MPMQIISIKQHQQVIHNNQQGKNSKTKVSNLPLGNLFKQIGEVISGGHNHENIANLINRISNQNSK